MKVAAFMGSPRKNGNTARLLKEFLKGAGEIPDVIINEISLREKKIAGCVGCEGCKIQNSCVVKDDMQELYPIIKEADVLVFAMPVYWWSMPGEMKSFVDRFYSLKKEELSGKRVYLLMAYGSALPNSGPELVEKTLKEICEYVGLVFAGVYGACTDDYVPVEENAEALKDIFQMGRNIK